MRICALLLSVGLAGVAPVPAADNVMVEQIVAKVNADILMSVLEGRKGACRDVVVLNAGAALYAADKVHDIGTGILLAQHTIDSGAALQKLESLVKFTQEN